jgi:hypothetical protein
MVPGAIDLELETFHERQTAGAAPSTDVRFEDGDWRHYRQQAVSDARS